MKGKGPVVGRGSVMAEGRLGWWWWMGGRVVKCGGRGEGDEESVRRETVRGKVKGSGLWGGRDAEVGCRGRHEG